MHLLKVCRNSPCSGAAAALQRRGLRGCANTIAQSRNSLGVRAHSQLRADASRTRYVSSHVRLQRICTPPQFANAGPRVRTPVLVGYVRHYCEGVGAYLSGGITSAKNCNINSSVSTVTSIPLTQATGRR
jgi:hypothetical protein